MLNDLCYSCRQLSMFDGLCEGCTKHGFIDCWDPIIVKPIVEPAVRWFTAVAIAIAFLAVVAACWATYFES